MKTPNFSIEKVTPECIVIRDEGPWSVFPTVTNGAEEVVRELMRRGRLRNGQRLLYYDSDRMLCQLMHWNGEFKAYGTADNKPWEETNS